MSAVCVLASGIRRDLHLRILLALIDQQLPHIERLNVRPLELQLPDRAAREVDTEVQMQKMQAQASPGR